MNITKFLQSSFVFILIICSINFFEFQGIKGGIIRYLQFAFLFCTVLISLPYLLPKRQGFILPVQLISFSILFSIIIAWFSWNQNLSDCIIGTILSLVWFAFFYLRNIQFPINKIEKIVIFYGFVYIFLYFFQFLHADTNYFVETDTSDLTRGITRIVFPGRGVFYLTTFIALNKLTNSKQNRILWSMLTLAGVVITVMQVTRQFIFATLIIYVFHFLHDQKLHKKLLVLLFFGGFLLFFIKSNNPITAGLKTVQNETVEAGSDYIRVRSGIFFLTDYSKSIVNKIFGNGVAYGENSKFKKLTDGYASNYGYYLADVGLIGVYARFGVFAVVGYLILFVKSFTIRLPKDYFYLKYYLWFLIFTSITSDTIFSSYDLITTVLVVYSYQILYEKNQVLLKSVVIQKNNNLTRLTF